MKTIDLTLYSEKYLHLMPMLFKVFLLTLVFYARNNEMSETSPTLMAIENFNTVCSFRLFI